MSVLRALANGGHQLHLLTWGKPDDMKCGEMRRICCSVRIVPQAITNLSASSDYFRRLSMLPSKLPYAVHRYRSGEMRTAIEEAVHMIRFDAIVSDTMDPIINLPDGIKLPIILNHHNVEHLILKRYLHFERNPLKWSYIWFEAEKLRAWEKAVCLRSNSVMVCSAQDKLRIERMCGHRFVYVVPNVVDVNSYAPTQDNGKPRIVYTGGMDWYPNRDAVEYFAKMILPEIRRKIPQIQFVVAGRNPTQEFVQRFRNAGVQFTGTVPDIRPELAKSSLCVVPLRIGSGTRLKILEAAAMGKAVVSTTLGAEGLDFVNQSEIVITDDPLQFAQSVIRLLQDSHLRWLVGKAARRRVEMQYSQRSLEESMQTALNSISATTCSQNKPLD